MFSGHRQTVLCVFENGLDLTAAYSRKPRKKLVHG